MKAAHTFALEFALLNHDEDLLERLQSGLKVRTERAIKLDAAAIVYETSALAIESCTLTLSTELQERTAVPTG